MQIPFRKIHHSPKSFEIEEDGVEFKGVFWRSSSRKVSIEGKIKGEILFVCDRCAEEFKEFIEDSFLLEAVDGAVKVEESLDMVECKDGVVDFDEIYRSETASIQSEYRLCDNCRKVENFEVEF